MTNLNELTVISADYHTDIGFFIVDLSNGKSLQCCLKSKQDHEDGDFYYVPQIEIENNGFDEGMSADCNSWAVVDGEWEHIELFLLDEARKSGIEIVA